MKALPAGADASTCTMHGTNGVRLYSRVVTQTRRVQLVEQHIHKVVDFYISQSQAANHAVRERHAACICTAELGTKVNNDCLRLYMVSVGEIFRTILARKHLT
ncbi:uncharacterized protein LOC135350206 [Halichondria panicea]|uniref:uncharacterized protein LOC135350206 n=1 Tax=Halichondria panicea TaxID=6063 RepID=UPI00312B7FD3